MLKDFTTEQIVEARIALNKLTKRLYDKRSSFAHKGFDPKRAATVKDYNMAHNILRLIIERLVSLYDEGRGIVSIDSGTPERNLDMYIERLKYNLRASE